MVVHTGTLVNATTGMLQLLLAVLLSILVLGVKIFKLFNFKDCLNATDIMTTVWFKF